MASFVNLFHSKNVRSIVKDNRKVYRERWWHYAEKRPLLYATIEGMERVLVAVQTSKFLSISFQPTELVYSHMTVVFALDDYASFSILNASWHTYWVLEYCSSLETRLRYLPSDGFETFPFPQFSPEDKLLETSGKNYYECRRLIMQTRQEGLTSTYNRFHDPEETAEDIARLRELHVEMDQAVATAYGWHNLDLGHGFHQTTQGVRYTISEEAKREVLDRLLALNFKRYEEEVREGLHDKKRKSGKKTIVAEQAGKRGLGLQMTLALPGTQIDLDL